MQAKETRKVGWVFSIIHLFTRQQLSSRFFPR
jgi:hypothetical protein